MTPSVQTFEGFNAGFACCYVIWVLPGAPGRARGCVGASWPQFRGGSRGLSKAGGAEHVLSSQSHRRRVSRDVLQEHIQTGVSWWSGRRRQRAIGKQSVEASHIRLILPPHQGLTLLLGFFQSICCQSPSAPVQRHPSITGSRKTGEGAGNVLENIKTTF